jgi:hypothetical protein
MRKLLSLLFFMQSWMYAQSRFDGTWKMNLDTLQFSGPPEGYLFADVMYHCKSCIPKVGLGSSTRRSVYTSARDLAGQTGNLGLAYHGSGIEVIQD